MINIVPCNDEIYPALVAEAEKDGHGCLSPTHVFYKDGRIVGCTSINSICSVVGWAKRGKEGMNAFDSVRWRDLIDGEAKRLGFKFAMLPVPRESNFFPYMNKLGCVMMSETTRVFLRPIP